MIYHALLNDILLYSTASYYVVILYLTMLWQVQPAAERPRSRSNSPWLSHTWGEWHTLPRLKGSPNLKPRLKSGSLLPLNPPFDLGLGIRVKACARPGSGARTPMAV